PVVERALELVGRDREALQVTLEVGEPEEYRLDALGLAAGEDLAAGLLVRRRPVLRLHKRHPFLLERENVSPKMQRAPDATRLTRVRARGNVAYGPAQHTAVGCRRGARPRHGGARGVRRRVPGGAGGGRGGGDRRRHVPGRARRRGADLQPRRRPHLGRSTRRDQRLLRRRGLVGLRLARPRAGARGPRLRPRLRLDEVLAGRVAAPGAERARGAAGRRRQVGRLRTGRRRGLRHARVDRAPGRERRRTRRLVVLRRVCRGRPCRRRRAVRPRSSRLARLRGDARAVPRPRRPERDPRRAHRGSAPAGLHDRDDRDRRAAGGAPVELVSEHRARRISRGRRPTQLPGAVNRLARLLAVAAAAAWLCAAASASRPGTPLEIGAVVPELTVRSLVGKTVEAMTGAGLGGAGRVTLTWRRGQKTLDPGLLSDLGYAIQQADAAGIDIYLTVYPLGAGHPPRTPGARATFAGWAASIVRRLPDLRHVIVGNEPNLNRFWLPQFDRHGNDVAAPAYVQLLART